MYARKRFQFAINYYTLCDSVSSFKFPRIFYQGEQVPALRSGVSRYIKQALLTQAGFGETAKEQLYGYSR